MKQLFLKYKEMILYIVFGAITTLVDLVVYKLCCVLFGTGLYLVWNVVAWAAAVLTAFFTNKLWVFESKSWAPAVLRRELPAFVGARVASLLIAEAGMFVAIDLLGCGVWSISLPFITVNGHDICKILLQVIVLILNYIFSKLVIFKKEKDHDGTAG
ncbi:MAG: GtrA family protein [Ruminococcaceae bacterium]|nr:GtrA family protein [Oscillospiraceae bacterium]